MDLGGKNLSHYECLSWNKNLGPTLLTICHSGFYLVSSAWTLMVKNKLQGGETDTDATLILVNLSGKISNKEKFVFLVKENHLLLQLHYWFLTDTFLWVLRLEDFIFMYTSFNRDSPKSMKDSNHKGMYVLVVLVCWFKI